MGQKRSKNQIRRERQKLRKVAHPEGQSLDLNEQKILQTEKSIHIATPTLIEPKPSPLVSGNEAENTLINNVKDATGNENSDSKNPDRENLAGNVDITSKLEDTNGHIIDKESVSLKEGHVVLEVAENEAKVENGETVKPKNLDLAISDNSTESTQANSISKNSNTDEVSTKTSITGNSAASENGKEVLETDKKAQILDIFSRLGETPATEPEEPLKSDELFSQYASVFDKFNVSANPENQHQVVAYSGDDTEMSDSDESGSEYMGEKPVSKRQKRLREKVPISVLKASAAKPQAVEWYDADAPDPYMVVYMKTALNHVDVPPHWQQKKEYLSSKRGVERAPFALPKFIANTGIAEMRNHDPEALKKLQRDRVQPKMGRLDIDYQKLHDAFFKHQTKPRMLPFGEVYSEGREKADQNRDDVARMRPGKISKSLRLAVGMSENETAVPPWITVMKELGKPPSYANLLIPGLDSEYTNLGYLVQYGEKGKALDFLGETWGSLEDGEESDIELEELDSEEEAGIQQENGPLSNEAINPSDGVESDEEQPERVEIAEYSKIKATPASTTASTNATLGTLYKILKEAPGDSSDGREKQRYELSENNDKAPAKTKAKLQHAPEETEDFRF